MPPPGPGSLARSLIRILRRPAQMQHHLRAFVEPGECRGGQRRACNHCVRFGPRVAATPATLVTGRLATPYPDGTCTRWTIASFPGAPRGDPIDSKKAGNDPTSMQSLW